MKKITFENCEPNGEIVSNSKIVNPGQVHIGVKEDVESESLD